MTRSIRRLTWGLAVLMVALLVQLTSLQFFQAPELNAMPGNRRVILTEYSRQRGPILVGQAPVASSKATGGELKYRRVYADGPLFASVTGFYSLVYGSTGLERAENDILSGTDPRLWVDRMQQLFAGRDVAGGAVTTTINAAAQAAAWEGIKGKVGSVVAIEPSTGAILAQVQSPSFNPNNLASHDSAKIKAYYEELDADPNKPLLNRPIARTIPPGSTFKIVTAAAALESGKFKADTVIPGPQTYKLPGSSVRLPNWTGTECGPNGKTTLADALAISCNTAFAWLANELGADALREQAEKFGFESSFDTPLRVATSRFPKDPDGAQLAMSGIGQYDVRATPMQMAMATAAIANGGLTMRPHLVENVSSPDLTTLEETAPEDFERAMSEENATSLIQMMVGVVDHGTGSNGKIPGVQVGGKTGTAQTAKDRPSIAWYVSFAPASSPRVAVAVAVENAGTNEVSGNQLAAPIARAVMSAVLSS